jgi:quinol---cytochrome c reductase iron-sulfur subunit
MNDKDTPNPGAEVNPHDTGDAVSLEHGHVAGSGALPARFENPGLPPHILRAADVDERSAKRAANQVVVLFALSVVGSLLFLIAYFAMDPKYMAFVPWFGHVGVQHVLMGLGLGLGMLCIGLGAVHWAKTLMPDSESVEERHPIAAAEKDRKGFVDTLTAGANSAQIGRRPLIAMVGGTAVGLVALPPLVQVVGGLGPMGDAVDELRDTFWQKGMRLMRDPELTPIKASDVTLGSVFHVLPEGIDKNLSQKEAPGQEFRHDEDLGLLERKAKAAVLLMRLDPTVFHSDKARDWGYQGIVAYSKICTHAGCPVGLYEQQTHHLLCPCHQSTFDVTQDCQVVFGPAKRPLPQLKISVDAEGYLVAQQGFQEPVGPSHWTRARS